MDYVDKVKSSCRQGEDLLGHKFLYNKDDDIVLFFPSKDSAIAYCYKKRDLRSLVKTAYNRRNIIFDYIVIPHTNQYITNPKDILNGDKKAFYLEREDNEDMYRRDFPKTYKAVWKGDSIFERPPEIGDEIGDEKKNEDISFVPSERYIESIREMNRIRQEREQKVVEPELEETNTEDIINTFYRYSFGCLERYRRQYNENKALYSNIDAPIYENEEDIRREGKAILLIRDRTEETYIWYFNGEEGRETENFPYIVSKKGDDYTFVWKGGGIPTIGKYFISWEGMDPIIIDGVFMPNLIKYERNEIICKWPRGSQYNFIRIYTDNREGELGIVSKVGDDPETAVGVPIISHIEYLQLYNS